MQQPTAAGWRLENSYACLDDNDSGFFSVRTKPTPVARPELVLLNEPLARELGLDPEALRGETGARIFAGNELPPGSDPIAQAYAGHQFGHFTLLGDGRAILLGEQLDPRAVRWDIQLKGSGQTPYSRRGDGRAALGPMLREYLISEAMAALGIPTTRSLAVVRTGERVFRQSVLPGAVLTRVAASHIRVGSFEYAANSGDAHAVKRLADYAIARHSWECRNEAHPYLAFLKQVIARQARLIAQWLHVGFIHGVMNTDNMLISGETIDYGPCAFMDRYDPGTVFSSIDRNGRYAYANQPSIAHWNLTRFAETLLPLLDTNPDAAIELAKDCLEEFSRLFSERWRQGMLEKLGLPRNAEPLTRDPALIGDLLDLMKKHRLDFTLTFRALTRGEMPAPAKPESAGEFAAEFAAWQSRWEAARGSDPRALRDAQERMRRANPNVIPRNHQVEAALAAFVDVGDARPFRLLLTALASPWEDRPEHAPYLGPAPDGLEPYQTFCGT